MKVTTTVFALALLLGTAVSQVQASEWGDTNYSNASVDAQVEEIPASIASDEPVAITEDALAEANANSYSEPEKAAVKEETLTVKNSEPAPRSSFSNISTVRNTYGVQTEERPPLKFYAAPFGGMTSMFGNTTVDASAQFAVGANVGLLVSSMMLVEVGYTYAEQSLSNPRYNTSSGIVTGTGVNNVFAIKQNSFDAGVKLFFLGRESRFRPYFGGGAGYVRSFLNYTPTYQQVMGLPSDFITNQVVGFGELGAEFAFTRSIVLTAMFKLNGVLSSSTSDSNSMSGSSDATQSLVGNSLSRTASYTLGAGLGIYF